MLLYAFKNALQFVLALPTKPDGITYFIMSTNSTQPEEHTTQSVNNNSSIVKTEGDSVTFVCSGVVGKPPEQFIFHKFHQGHVLVKNYTHVTTHSYLIDGMCNFYGTSYLTMQVTRHDDQAIIRCTVDFVLADLYEESDLVQVLCKSTYLLRRGNYDYNFYIFLSFLTSEHKHNLSM